MIKQLEHDLFAWYCTAIFMIFLCYFESGQYYIMQNVFIYCTTLYLYLYYICLFDE